MSANGAGPPGGDCVETERDVGLEVARKWAKEDDKYRALLRIAKAVEEARSRSRFLRRAPRGPRR